MASSFDDCILPVFAALHPDGSIEVELLIPENDEPSIAKIPALRETRALAIPNARREISLDADGDPGNATLRRVVNEFVRKAEEKRLDALRNAAVAQRA